MSQIIAIDDYSRERSGKAKNILSRSKSSRSFPLSQKCVFFVPEETLEYYNNDDVSSVSCRLLNKKKLLCSQVLDVNREDILQSQTIIHSK